MANPGPATTVTTNYQNLASNQALVLIAQYKGLPCTAAGDFVMPVLSGMTSFVPTTVVTTNATITMAAATVGIYTAVGQGGTAVLTTAALTGQTSTAFAYVRAATAAAAMITVGTEGNLYVNIGTTVASSAVDLYVYGYNVS